MKVKAYLALWKQLTAKRVIQPKTHLLVNEASAELKAEINKNCTIQLVPPNNHKRNLAERAIQTFKSHFKAVLAGVDNSFPMQLWDKLLPQTVLTLNLLRQLIIAPVLQEIRLPLMEWQSIGHGRRGHSEGACDYSVD